MKMTILPDMEAKRINRKRRKEKRRRKKDRRADKRKYKANEIKPVWKLVLVSVLISFWVCGIAFAAYAAIAYEVKCHEVEQKYTEWNTFLCDNIKRVCEDENKTLNDANIALKSRVSIPYDSEFVGNSVALVYDISNGKFIAGDDGRFDLYSFDMKLKIDKGYTYYAGDNNYEFYEPADEINETLLDELTNELIYDKPRSYAVVKDIYIENNIFYIGDVEYYTRDNDNSDAKCVKCENYITIDTTGMKHIVFDDIYKTGMEKKEAQYKYYYYICSAKVPEDIMQNAKDHLYECVQNNQSSCCNLVGYYTPHKPWVKEYYQYFNVRIKDGKEYGLVVGYRINYLKEFKTIFFNGFLVALVAFILLAGMIFYNLYIRRLARREYVEYQRNLTNAMAHDLKSPIMAISGMAENLKENIHTEKREYYAEQIMTNLESMNRMIEQILGYSKLEYQKDISNKSKIKLEDIVYDLREQYEDDIAKKNIKVEINGTIEIVADPILTKQLVDNLFRNSILYTDENGIIRIELDKKQLIIRNTYSGKLDTKQARALIEAFAKSEDRKKSGGHGLGLSISLQIAKMHGWEFSVSVEDNEFVAKVSM